MDDGAPLLPPTCDDRQIWDIWLSRWQLPAVTVADELGVFAQLVRKPATVQDVASRLDPGRRRWLLPDRAGPPLP